ncbi:MAG: OB-fold nucleic acid binding domain-containing protein, partial [Patescibacteria group bacterium]
QEQIMQISRELAGFTKGEADTLRKAMGKKIPTLLAEQKEKFVSGCVQNGVDKELAEKIFSFIEPFAGYGFNRSHAACYALIGYQTAYLKAHFPAEFMAALLTSDQNDIDRIAIEIDECRKMGLQIMPPDVNESFATFTVVTSGTIDNRIVAVDEKIDTIRFGLGAVKNVGGHICDMIIAERKANGPYLDIFNFLERISDRDLNKKSMESLIKTGGLDRYGERGELLFNLEMLLSFNKENGKMKNSHQDSLFSSSPQIYVASYPKLVKAPAALEKDFLRWEKELLGLYITEHPLNHYLPYFSGFVIPLVELKGREQETGVNTAGVISTIKKIITRNNQTMLFVKIEDAITNVELLVFPKLLQETSDIWTVGKIVLCRGRVSDKDQETKILVNKVVLLDEDNPAKSIDDFKRILLESRDDPRNNYRNYPKKTEPSRDPIEAPAKVEATVPALRLIFNRDLSSVELDKLRSLFLAHPGDSPVYFKIKDNILKTGFQVAYQSELITAIKSDFVSVLEVVEN